MTNACFFLRKNRTAETPKDATSNILKISKKLKETP
ncbi:MAG: hypothetical protein ACI8ZM_005151, partial [Crocinitomix sp.]